MKRYYFTIASILVLVIGIASCSNDETKTQNQIAARPEVPLQNGEVKIGTQIWMAKNLNVSLYRNGDPIPHVTDPTQWASLTTGAWCNYENNAANGTVYGKLYNWYAVNDTRGLAPVGYHLPSDVEWTSLTTFLGGPNIAGAKMKATTLWRITNDEVTNSSRFTGLPGGVRSFDGAFFYIGMFGIWWSSTEYSGSLAWYLYLFENNNEAFIARDNKKSGFSVRCIKD